MLQVKIVDASTPQLASFAKDVQQIEKVPTDRGAILAALLESGWDKDYVLIDGEPDTDEAPVVAQFEQPQDKVARMPASGFGYWRESPMVRMKILPTDRPGGNEPAHPSINGSPCLVVQRNVLVEIPYDFYLVLKQAGGTKVLPGEKPTDPFVEVDYYDYPMVDVVLPSAESIAKWQARTSGDELGRPKAAAA